MADIIEKSPTELAVEAIVAEVTESKKSTPLRRVTRGLERTGVRIVYSIAGEDGHAPLQEYGRPYVRGPEVGPYEGNIMGYEYRTRDASGAYVPHDYAIVLRAAPVEGRGVVSWAYTPIADETIEEAETEEVQVEIPGEDIVKLVKGKQVITKGVSTFSTETSVVLVDGAVKYKAPVVKEARNGVIDGMLDMLVGAGLGHWYWRSLEELEKDTGETAAEVRKNWPQEWVGENGLRMLEIS